MKYVPVISIKAENLVSKENVISTMKLKENRKKNIIEKNVKNNKYL